jgi:hypothetical protein
MAGRGTLSSIDMLPEEAAEDVTWAVQELAVRRLTQEEIREAFNTRLAAKGIDPISRSAFHRKAMRLAAVQRRMSESRALFEGLAPQFTADKVDDSNVILGELIKTLIQELLVDDTARDPKGAMELASAYQKTVSAMKISSERRAKLEAELAAKTVAAIDVVAKERGFTTETTEHIKSKILGL